MNEPAYINDPDAIVWAGSDGDYDLLVRLVNAGADVNIRAEDGRAYSGRGAWTTSRVTFGGGGDLLRVQIKSGAVTQVIVGQSAGHGSLDAAAIKALRTWRFKPGAVPYRKITSVPLSPPQTEKETLVKGAAMTFTL